MPDSSAVVDIDDQPEVFVVEGPSRVYVRSSPDDDPTDNLLSLRRF